MKRRIRSGFCLCCLLTGLLFLLDAAQVTAGETIEKTLSPYFVIAGENSSVEHFPLKDTRVSANIDGVIADVHIVQRYTNEGVQAINARYVFPASTRASVHGMKMTVGDRVVTARIRERETAQKEFAAAREQGKSASLLQQQRPNVFSMDVANIMPGDEVKIDLHYSELLVPAEGVYEFVCPMVVGPRYSSTPESEAAETDKWVKSPYLPQGNTPQTAFDIAAAISTGIPLQDLTCPSHKVDVQWAGTSNAKVTLSPSNEFAGNRDFILRYRLTGNEIQSGLMLSKGDRENFFLLMVQPPERVKQADIPPREYIFVLDVSGSMHGFPLDTAKVLIGNLIGNLRQTDKFNVVLFSGASAAMAPESVGATHENIDGAIRLIDSQRGGGGTELAAALKTALALPSHEGVSRSVVVITDGYIAAEAETFDLVAKNLNRCNFFAFGIGASVNRHLIEGIAKAGMGEPFVVTKPEEAKSAAACFKTYVESPLLTGIEIQFNGFEAYDVEPPKVPDLFAGRPLIVFGKWRGEQKGRIEVSGQGGRGGYYQSFDVSRVEPAAADGLRFLWARSKVARLSDFATGTARHDHKEEITSLGIRYSLLTAYTSFVAVLEQVRNTGPAANVDQPLPLPLGVSNYAVGCGVTSAPEPELTLLLICALPVAAALCLPRRRMKRRFRG